MNAVASRAVRGRSGIAVIVVLAAASALRCTLLVSFDDRGDASCGGGACDGDLDATFDGQGFGDDSLFPEGDGSGDDTNESSDAGDCTVLSEGVACAKPNACREASTCHDGVCTVHPLKDGTTCGTAPSACYDAPACAAGICAAAAPTTDGAQCGMAPDACHVAPLCKTGVCAPAAEAANGTTCGLAPDTCHDTPKCASGKCAAAVAFAEGAVPTGAAAHERCCSGNAADTATDKNNCGVCGIVCKGSETCSLLDGQYLCVGCAVDGDCWSGCCSLDPTPNHCTPSLCTSTGCKTNICPGGAHCETGTVDYCTY
jgi:hypothetical protein